MKLNLLSVLLTALYTLSMPEVVDGASLNRRQSGRCRARQSGASSSSIIASSPAPQYPAPAPSSTINFTPSPAPPPPSPPKTQAPAPKSTQPSNSNPPSSGNPGSNSNPNGGSNPPTSFEEAYLTPQNNIRVQKGASAYTWNNTLAEYAQTVANTCVFKHSGGPYGENLSAGTHPFTPGAGIQLWLNEEPQYDPNDPVPSHYTQVVWKGSKQVGCAVTTCSDLVDAFSNADYYVCEYYPAGNVIGEFPENVET